MVPTPAIHKTINVTSNRLCFGSLHNIWSGASASRVDGLPKVRFEASGTVKVQPVEYNIPALNGTWNAYQLIRQTTNQVSAWFLAHSSVDPQLEIDKILKISGSPYEIDSGSSMNNEMTEKSGVFIINRYDWGYYDTRCKDEIGDDTPEGEDDFLANDNSLGIVDIAEAKTMVSEWKAQRPSKRGWSGGGAWLYCPYGEYMFGRFGFDDSHVAARSFLFFSTNTYFTQTVFAGMEQTLRKEETGEERFQRRLQEGYDFSGIEQICEWSLSSPKPSMAQCFGPYDLSEHVLTAEDINALRVYRDDLGTGQSQPTPIGEFVEPWKEPLYDLLNEMALSYLQRKVVPLMGNLDLDAAGEVLFPPASRSGPDSGDGYYYPSFMKRDAKQIPGFNYVSVGGRIKSFLSRFESESVVFNEECIAGIVRVLARFFAEALDEANIRARSSERNRIVPSDVRCAVYFHQELLSCLQYSRVFWEGRQLAIRVES
ncbi:hypothetical protein OQA88_5640 [Cercophora sp. LCS_1]